MGLSSLKGFAWILNPTSDGTNNFNTCNTELAAYTAYTDTDVGADANGGADNPWLVRKNAETSEGDETVKYNYYVAFSWSVTFTYTFGGAEGTNNVAIFLDLKNSNIDVEEIEVGDHGVIRNSLDGGVDKNTSNGFRIAFYPVTTGDALVDATNSGARIFAKNGTNRKYISSVTDDVDGTVAYNENVFNTSSNTTRRGENLASTDVAAMADKICTLSSTTNSQKIICVAWFEGTDPSVVTEAVMENVKADLTFYSRFITVA